MNIKNDRLRPIEELIMSRVPNYHSLLGPYFEEIDDFRNSKFIRQFRKKIRSTDQLDVEKINRELKNIRNEIMTNKLDEANIYQSIFLAVASVVPGLSLLGLVDEAASYGYDSALKRKYGWAGLLADIEQKGEGKQTTGITDVSEEFEKSLSLYENGVGLFEEEKYKKAREEFVKSLSISKRIGDPSSQSKSLFYIANCEKRIGNKRISYHLSEESFEISKKFGYNDGDLCMMGLNLWFMGSISHEQGALTTAEEKYKSALEILEKFGESNQRLSMKVDLQALKRQCSNNLRAISS